MPKPTSISTRVTGKYNLGDYESVEYEIQIWAQVTEEEEIEGVSQYLFQQGQEQIAIAAKEELANSEHQESKIKMRKFKAGKEVTNGVRTVNSIADYRRDNEF